MTHIGFGKAAPYVLMPGDPGRVQALAETMDAPRFVAQSREFVTWACELDGAEIMVTSSGIGGPSTAIAVHELAEAGAHTIVRVGTAGAMSDKVIPGDLVIAQAAIRDGGTSRAYLPLAYPAVADFTVTSSLLSGARGSTSLNVHVGVTQEKDSYYAQHSPHLLPLGADHADRWSQYGRAGALCSEMESATLFTVGACLNVRTGAILLVGGHADMSPMSAAEELRFSMDTLLTGAREGLRALVHNDNVR